MTPLPGDETPCPDPQQFADYTAGALPDRFVEAFESHLTACAPCRQQLVDLTETSEEVREGGAGSSRLGMGGRRAFWAGAAAAGLLCAVVWTAFRRDPAASDPALPVAIEYQAGRILSADRSGGKSFSLPDGTILDVQPGADLQLLETARGERARVLIREGAAEVRVAKQKGTFRMESRGGEIEVLGTRFRANAFLLNGVGPVLCVEVHEGKVALRNPLGETILGPDRRGISLAGERPVPMEKGGSYREAAEMFQQTMVWDLSGWRVRPGRQKYHRLMAAAFWGADWKAEIGPEFEIPPLLLGMRPGSLGLLRRKFQEEDDPKERAAIAQAIDAQGGLHDRRVLEFLEQASRDPQPEVARVAQGLLNRRMR